MGQSASNRGGFLPTNQRQQQPPPGSMAANRGGGSPLPLDLQIQRIQQQLDRTMGQKTPTGYGALAKIISSSSLRKKQGKLYEQLQQQQAQKKQEFQKITSGFAGAENKPEYIQNILSEFGGDVPQLLNVLSQIQKFNPAQYENVNDPYGQGGFGQRKMDTGEITGYQSAPTTWEQAEIDGRSGQQSSSGKFEPYPNQPTTWQGFNER